MVRNGNEVFGKRPKIDCDLKGKVLSKNAQNNDDRLFLAYDNMSQLKLSMKDTKSTYRGVQIGARKEWLGMEGYMAGTSKFEKYNDLFVPLHDASMQSAGVIAPVVENVIAGTFWAGELATDVIWCVANPLYAIHLAKV